MNRAVTAILVCLLAATASTVWAHCQVPCGIYNDPARLVLMEENVTTIEKSMKQIQELTTAKKANVNQAVRWVLNKEQHADELMDIVTYYFLTQRIKPADPSDKKAYAKYLHELTLLHGMMVHAMKAKQTTDVEHCNALRKLIGEFRQSYLGEPKGLRAK